MFALLKQPQTSVALLLLNFQTDVLCKLFNPLTNFWIGCILVLYQFLTPYKRGKNCVLLKFYLLYSLSLQLRLQQFSICYTSFCQSKLSTKVLNFPKVVKGNNSLNPQRNQNYTFYSNIPTDPRSLGSKGTLVLGSVRLVSVSFH